MTAIPPGAESLQQLLQRLSIATPWSLILIGDGSGSRWGRAAGWACVALEPDRLDRKLFYGAMSDGTVNLSELMAYLAPLTWYAGRVAEERKTTHQYEARMVHIVTDSEYVRAIGSSRDSAIMRRNSALWLAYELFNRQGIRLHWHYVPREDVELNRLVDRIGRTARLQLQAISPAEVVRDTFGLTLDNCNPWE